MSLSSSHTAIQVPFLVAVLLDALLFGVVSQQFYEYWNRGFKDSIRLKIFVTAQYFVVLLQGILIWIMAIDVLIIFNVCPASSYHPDLWQGPANSLCQLFLILSANVFLAARIRVLTNSRFQSGIVVTLSAFAFVIGMITNVITWKMALTPSAQNITSVIWHAIQALVECLITIFLSRTLLKSRSGVRRSDSIVDYLVRNVIQTGCLATIWAIAALVTWFWLSRNVTIYRIFDITSGTIYTHAIFDTLLSRTQLRENMALQTHIELGLSSQNLRGQSSRPSAILRFLSSVSAAEVSNRIPAASDSSESTPGPGFTSGSDSVELKSLPAGKLDV